jgi:hypothetical protein
MALTDQQREAMWATLEQWKKDAQQKCGCCGYPTDQCACEGFDYEYLGRCQYPVESYGTAEPETDCHEPAMARGTWVDGNGEETGHMLLCKEHLEKVIQIEKEHEGG